MGERVPQIWRAAAAACGLDVEVGGIAPLSHLAFVGPDRQVIRTLFTQLMLERGFLATGGFYASYAHQDEHLDGFDTAVGEAFAEIVSVVAGGSPADALHGPVAHTGFARLT